jgi:uncharacterized protein YjbJ (UPF0337 family)
MNYSLLNTTIYKGIQMNWNQIEGNWKQLKGNVKQQWGKLTDDQLDIIAGKRDQLAGKIQEVYGTAMNDVEKELTEWQNKQKEMDCCGKEKPGSNSDTMKTM